jgi:hypothetical protein
MKSSPKTGLCLELPTQRFISQFVMPENQIPATQPESGATPDEFNFTKPAPENPRIRRRSLKPKPGGLIKPAAGPTPAARAPERETPASPPVAKPSSQEKSKAKIEPSPQVSDTSTAPPRAIPSATAAKAPTQPALSASPPQGARPVVPGPTAAASPHGTRPATLYYSSQPRKETEAPSPMKTIHPANPASVPSSSTAMGASAAARPAISSPRPVTTNDYRANVERQSREQKSVGNILSYVVYGLIFLFVVAGALAAYGANVIFAKIHDQSQTVSDLDQKYAASEKDLNGKLATTQDSLTQALAQISRQQDLIVKEQEDINRLITAANDTTAAIKLEKQGRLQEAANLRARIRELEYKAATAATTQKF